MIKTLLESSLKRIKVTETAILRQMEQDFWMEHSTAHTVKAKTHPY